jgi:hypothetical protein
MALYPWTGSWTAAPDNLSAPSAVSAITRAIGAASAPGASDRASHNPPVVGSSPTRPTYQILNKDSKISAGGNRPYVLRMVRGPPDSCAKGS